MKGKQSLGWRILSIIMTLAIALGAFSWAIPQVEASPATIYVPDNYPSIQAAVDAASPGDTIIVRDGTYTENVDVNKSLTIQSENGADSTIVQAANPDDHVFEVTADYVEISGFMVIGTGAQTYKAGIFLDYTAEYCNISYINTLDNDHGIYLRCSSNNVLSSNKVSNNRHGIYLSNSSNNTLTDNTMSGNQYNFFVWGGHRYQFTHNIDISNTVNGKPIQYLQDRDNLIIDSSWDVGYLGLVNCTNIVVKDLALSNNGQGVLVADSTESKIEGVNVSNNYSGIILVNSYDNILSGNTANSNTHGINLIYSLNNTLSGNTANSNNWGIYLHLSSNNALIDNTTSNNSDHGIDLCSSSNNTLTGNVVSNSRSGIRLWSSSNNNALTHNIISNNDYGLVLSYSSNNKVHLNNFTNNNDNVYSSDSANIWSSPEEITYTYNGNTYTNYLGNYWSDYTGSDADGDGIGNTPYSIDSDNDNYPLVQPFENYGIGEDPFNYQSEYELDWNELREEERDALPYVMNYAKEYNLSPALIMAIIRQESNFNADALGDYWDGVYHSFGYMQVSYVAAIDTYPGYVTDKYRGTPEQWQTDGLDPDQNIKYGTRYLQIQYNRFKDLPEYDAYGDPLRNTISAYNAGYPTTSNAEYVDGVIHGRDLINGQHRGYEFFLTIRIPQNPKIVVEVHSPVDMVVTDPDGLTISKLLNEIPGATYTETDIDGDGDLDAQIRIPDRKIGDYVITVIPKPDAEPTHTYSLEVSVAGVAIVLADNVQISDIPSEGYIVRSTETTITQIVPAIVDFDPDILNIKSKGKFVTVYIELPPGYDVGQIDVANIMLNGEVQALVKPTQVGDYDSDGILDLMVKFDRDAVQGIIFIGDAVEITISGEVAGIDFEGSDSIRVINE